MGFKDFTKPKFYNKLLHFAFFFSCSWPAFWRFFYKRKILPRFVHEARIKGFTKATKSLIFNLQNTLQIHGKFWYYMLHQHRPIHCAPVEEENGILHIISMRIRRILSFKIIRPCLCFTFYFFDVKMPYLPAGLSFLEFLCSNICSLKKVNHKNIYIYENEFLSSSFTYHSVRLHFILWGEIEKFIS